MVSLTSEDVCEIWHFVAYGVGLDIAVDDFVGSGVHGDAAAAEAETVGYDGLVVDSFEAGGGGGGLDDLFGRHGRFLCVQ